MPSTAAFFVAPDILALDYAASSVVSFAGDLASVAGDLDRFLLCSPQGRFLDAAISSVLTGSHVVADVFVPAASLGFPLPDAGAQQVSVSVVVSLDRMMPFKS